ncbi:MAG: HAD-IIB family hydrolase [Desulfobacterales bacterium]|nr:HAD-IIB family hydrolase [Desulfobacterales bacterium]
MGSFIIFTDLDGTLLDHNTYGWEEALPALELCKKLHVPVVIVSSKTRAEIELLLCDLPASGPFISENGGGIFFPCIIFKDPPPETSLDKGMWKWPMGLSYKHLIKELQGIRTELGLNIKGFSDMSIEEISRLTGLDRQTSRLAAKREYDEPFIILEEQEHDRKAVFHAAIERGLTVTIGGRFYHLKGNNDKGLSVKKLISRYRQCHDDILTIALGDSPNDFLMLEQVDYPVLVRSKKVFPELVKKIPGLRVTHDMGPTGWSSAVLDILEGINA